MSKVVINSSARERKTTDGLDPNISVLSGTADAGLVVNVFDDDALLGPVQRDAAQDGNHIFTATTTDLSTRTVSAPAVSDIRV